MKKLLQLSILTCLIAIAGCASKTTLSAPCPGFGAGCTKTPINSWDYTR